MYRISIYDYFSSAHQLKGYEGKCEEIHGHNWKVEIEVEGNELDKVGMLIDFKELKNILKGVIDELDHKTRLLLERKCSKLPNMHRISYEMKEILGDQIFADSKLSDYPFILCCRELEAFFEDKTGRKRTLPYEARKSTPFFELTIKFFQCVDPSVF